jgi:hypothetical protein
VAQQQKVEAIERHREECLAEFTCQSLARQSNDADREWLARQPGGRQAGGAPTDTETDTTERTP